MSDFIEDYFFIQFYNPPTSLHPDELSARVLSSTIVESISISADFVSGQGKSISITLKNPENIFNSDHAGNSVNAFGQDIQGTYDWRDYMIPDGQFFVAKGSYTEWLALNDEDKDKRLLGIFRMNNPKADMIGQKLAITGQDLMKYMIRAVAYSSEADIWQYPPNNWGKDLMSTGQIVHDVFHKMGVWHYHKDTTINNDSYGLLTPDGTIFYSTNMYFDPSQPKADEQIFNMVHPYDFIKTLSNYTGYPFFVRDTVVDGTPRPVFHFQPPSFADDTLGLWGTNDIEFYNEAIMGYHDTPIKITAIEYGKDDNDIRGYLITTTADSTSIIENTSQSGQYMREKNWSIGVIKEPSIHDWTSGGKKISAAQAIGASVMSQIIHNYRFLNITFNDWIKFGNFVYNMNVNLDLVNIHINSNYYCKDVTWSWNGKLFQTQADFSYFSSDDIVRIAPDVHFATGDGHILIYFTRTGADSYKVYLNGTLNHTITGGEGEPIYYTIEGLTNGQSYAIQVGAVYGTAETKSPVYNKTPNINNEGGGHGGGRVSQQ